MDYFDIYEKGKERFADMVKQEKRLFKGAALALSLLLLLGSLAGCGGKPQDVSSADGPTNTYTPPVNEDGYAADFREDPSTASR